MLAGADPVGLVGRVEPRAVGIDDKAARARSQVMDAGLGPSATRTINGEDVDPAAGPRREIDLRRERVFERRGEGADVGQERRVGRRGKRAGRSRESRDHRRRGSSEERATGKDLGVASGRTHRDLAGLGRSRKPAEAAQDEV